MNPIVLQTIHKHEISPTVFNVLSCIALREGSIKRSEIAGATLGMIDIYGDFSLAEYEEAVHTCLTKNLLKILSTGDCQDDRERWRNDLDQFCGEIEYVAGNTDFTQRGGHLFASIRSELDVQQGKRPYSSIIGYSWRIPGQVRMFAAFEDTIRVALRTMLNGENALANTEDIKILRVDNPVEIRSWWINRFVQLPIGYRASVHYV